MRVWRVVRHAPGRLESPSPALNCGGALPFRTGRILVGSGWIGRPGIECTKTASGRLSKPPSWCQANEPVPLGKSQSGITVPTTFHPRNNSPAPFLVPSFHLLRSRLTTFSLAFCMAAALWGPVKQPAQHSALVVLVLQI
eukprot:1155282-Pelagomonas_calceolata.AAC.2